ncbi:MAG: hypothetical protein Q8N69_03770 [bacterium]|nr:hypothetical protein [bacterium]
MEKKHKKANKTAQDAQDDIFRKMSADKKIKLSSELASFCLKLNSLNGNIKPGKTSY